MDNKREILSQETVHYWLTKPLVDIVIGELRAGPLTLLSHSICGGYCFPFSASQRNENKSALHSATSCWNSTVVIHGIDKVNHESGELTDKSEDP